jgi:hypothetical protein
METQTFIYYLEGQGLMYSPTFIVVIFLGYLVEGRTGGGRLRYQTILVTALPKLVTALPKCGFW